MTESFETMLSGGHHNSLGRTIEVVDLVLADHSRLDELFNCYFSDDELVRLRTSNAVRRVWTEQITWWMPYMDRFLNEIAKIDQASTQWTLALLFRDHYDQLSSAQQTQAVEIVKNNLATHTDWIVLNNSMDALAGWAKQDDDIKTWMRPHLERLQNDNRKSVAKRATKFHQQLYGT